MWETGIHKGRDFSENVYEEAYEATLKGIEFIKQLEYHWAKFCQTTRQWLEEAQ
jgi:hypothetical protein